MLAIFLFSVSLYATHDNDVSATNNSRALNADIVIGAELHKRSSWLGVSSMVVILLDYIVCHIESFYN
jgi:hypothetical protein